MSMNQLCLLFQWLRELVDALHCMLTHVVQQLAGPACQFCRWPFCCYVMSEAIASRKHSYTLYAYLVVKFWQVEMWELAGDAGTHVLTHLCGCKTRCISLTNHLSPFMMSDSLFSQTTVTDTNMFNSVDFAPLRFHEQDTSYSTNLFSPSITTWFKLLGLTARLQPPSFSSLQVGLSAGHEFSNIGGFPRSL